MKGREREGESESESRKRAKEGERERVGGRRGWTKGNESEEFSDWGERLNVVWKVDAGLSMRMRPKRGDGWKSRESEGIEEWR